MIPSAFQQMTALSQGRHIEPPAQTPVHNPDPLGLFPHPSLFAGSIMVPQQSSIPQAESTASRAPVVTTRNFNSTQRDRDRGFEGPFSDVERGMLDALHAQDAVSYTHLRAHET